MSLFLDMLTKLTDVYNKFPTSNMGKLFQLVAEPLEEIKRDLELTEEWLSIDKAQGTTLDLHGARVGQKRGKASDDIYRVLIKAKIAQDFSDGTINSMIESLALTVNSEKSAIKLKELWQEGIPRALRLEGLPIAALNKVGLTAGQFAYIVQKVAPAGVRVESVNLVGSFSFSSQRTVSESSTTAGFAPLDQSTGGTLGGSIDPKNVIDLPI